MIDFDGAVQWRDDSGAVGLFKKFQGLFGFKLAKQLIMNFLGLFLQFLRQCPETENDSPTSSPREDS